MSKVFYFLATVQYKTEATKWLQSVARGESASVVFAPKTDRFVRLDQLLNDPKLIKSAVGDASHYLLQRMDFYAHDVEDMPDLENLIAAQVNLSKHFSTLFTFEQFIKHLKKHKLTLVLIVPEAEKFLVPEGKAVLSHLSYLIENYDYIRVISFFEADITHPSLLSLLPASAQLYENVFRYPLYTREQTLDFVRLLEKHYDVNLTHEIEQVIIKACGGHFWLVKEAVRHIKLSGAWDPTEEGMWFRLRTIYNLMLPSERSLLEKLTLKKSALTSAEELSREHLISMKVIDGEDKPLIGLFKEFMKTHQEFRGEIKLKSNHIYLNQVPIDTFFSRKEQRIIRVLIENKNHMVSRDEIARHIWPINTQNHYSDWAIDQLMARLRRRLRELSIPPTLLHVVRGKGYLLKI